MRYERAGRAKRMPRSTSSSAREHVRERPTSGLAYGVKMVMWDCIAWQW